MKIKELERESTKLHIPINISRRKQKDHKQKLRIQKLRKEKMFVENCLN